MVAMGSEEAGRLMNERFMARAAQQVKREDQS